MSRAADLSSLKEGAVLAGRYRLARCLGEGGMGVVWEGTQLATGKHVAIKILKPRDDANSGADAARFLREARIVAGLSHRNIVQVFDYCDVEGEPVFLVMELLEGKPLSEMLAHRGAPLPVSEALAILLPVASAIAAAHAAGVVHRDLKPDNIFLAQAQRDASASPSPSPSPEMRNEKRTEVKVVDFGLAKPVATDALATAVTQTGSVMGTPFYMSPEQVYGDKTIDGASDVWSLGVVIHECVCGTRPFVGDNFGQIFKAITRTTPPPLRTLAPSTPPALEALVVRMLAAEKGARPSMAVVVEELAALASGQARVSVPLLSTKTERLPASIPPPAQPQAARTLIDAATTVREAPHVRRRQPWMITAAALGAVIIVASTISIIAIVRPAPRASGLTPMSNSAAVAAAPQNEGEDAGVVPFASITPLSTGSQEPFTADASAPKAAKAKPTSPRVINRPSRDDNTADPLGAGRF